LTDRNAGALDETARLISTSQTGEPDNKVNEQLICREADRRVDGAPRPH
jgi:hypothetical protein